MSKRLERAIAGWTRSAISIQASGYVKGRINRPDTRKHLNLRTSISRKTSCIHRGVHTRTFRYSCDSFAMELDLPRFRIGALDIAEAISERIGSYVDMNFFQFLAAEGDEVRCWYMNGGGSGPSYEVLLSRSDAGWLMALTEHPPGVEQTVEVP